MNNTDNSAGSWERIQAGVRDTERLLGQKKYNTAMIKARQTLEFMVKSLCQRYDIVEGGLIDMIDRLYEGGIINKTTCEHYHKIRTIGNKAIHEDDNNAYNANQAHHLLSQEVYTFANDYNKRKPKSSSRPAAPSAVNRPGPRATQNRPSGRSSARPSGRSSQKSRRKNSYGGINPLLLKLLIPLAVVVILILIIQLFPKKKAPVEPTSSETVTVETTMETTVPPTTEIPTTAPPVTVYTVKGNNVNVRSGPNTTSNVLGKLSNGTVLEYVRDENAEWVVINYNGTEAYISKQFVSSTAQ